MFPLEGKLSNVMYGMDRDVFSQYCRTSQNSPSTADSTLRLVGMESVILQSY